MLQPYAHLAQILAARNGNVGTFHISGTSSLFVERERDGTSFRISMECDPHHGTPMEREAQNSSDERRKKRGEATLGSLIIY